MGEASRRPNEVRLAVASEGHGVLEGADREEGCLGGSNSSRISSMQRILSGSDQATGEAEVAGVVGRVDGGRILDVLRRKKRKALRS